MNDLTEAKQFSLTPRTFEEAMKFCTTLAKSELVPKDFVDKPANILVAVQWGMELGLQPMQAMQSIAVINGRPSLWGDAVIGLVRASGLCEYIYEEVDEAGIRATCRTKRQGDKHEVVRIFTQEDAKKANLWGKAGPWTQYPKRMLQLRARSWCLRDVYPDVLRGVHVAEEQMDIPPEKDVTAEGSVVPMPKATTAAPTEPAKADPGKAEAPAAAAENPEAQKATENTSGVAESDFKTPASKGQVALIRSKAKSVEITEAEILKEFKIETLDGISVATGNIVLKFLADPAGYGSHS